jgi:hypothetical protein
MTFTKEQLLDALGIEEEKGWIPIALAGFGVGCLVGAAVSMLLAPKSGRELRGDLAERGRNLIQRGKQELEERGINVERGQGPSQTPSPY